MSKEHITRQQIKEIKIISLTDSHDKFKAFSEIQKTSCWVLKRL